MLLAIYLNDHLAGATLGRDLSRRTAAGNRGSAYGPFLEDLARRVDEDRDALLEIMKSLDVGVDRVKVLGGWTAEKLGRLKLNGRLLGYSPLSRVVELEGLLLGVRGKLALWSSLQALAAQYQALDESRLHELIERAEEQLRGLEEHRLRASAEALSPS